MRKYNKSLQELDGVQQYQATQLLERRKHDLKAVIRKNRALIQAIPEDIASQDLKDQFLTQRKELLKRIVESEVDNKMHSEWTLKAMNRQKAKNAALDK